MQALRNKRTSRRSVETDPKDFANLETIARTIAEEESLWRRRVRHDPNQRRFARLMRTEHIEAWLLSWTSEQGIELHDHGGSSGVVLVVEGELTEHFTELESRAPLRSARWPRGSAHTFGPGHVHDLRNEAVTPATSIHVYSPPLTTMTFYRHDEEAFLAPLRVESVVEPVRRGFAPTRLRTKQRRRKSVELLVSEARARLRRVDARRTARLLGEGALVVDIRPAAQRAQEGEIPGATIIERNVLEWRLDPASKHRLAVIDGYEQPIVVVCSEGYASSLAAAALQDLGLVHATDLVGGFQAWAAAGLPVRR